MSEVPALTPRVVSPQILGGTPQTRAAITTRRLTTEDLPAPTRPLSFAPNAEGAALSHVAEPSATNVLRTREAAISFLARAHYHQLQFLSVVAPDDERWARVFASIKPQNVASGPETWQDMYPLEATVEDGLIPSIDAGFSRLCTAAKRAAIDLEFVMGGAQPPVLLTLPFALIPVGGLSKEGVVNRQSVLTVATAEPMIDYVLPESWKAAIAAEYGCEKLAFVYTLPSALRKLLRIYSSEGFQIPYKQVALPNVPPLDNSQRPAAPSAMPDRVVPLVDVSILQPRGHAVDMFPMSAQTKNRMIPVYGNRTANMLVLATAVTPDAQKQFELEKQLGSKHPDQRGVKIRLTFVLGDADQINAVVARGESANVDTGSLVRSVEEKISQGGHGSGAASITEIDTDMLAGASKGEGGGNTNAGMVLNAILAEAMDLGASDVHISNHQHQPKKPGEAAEDYTRVRYTVDGETRSHSVAFPGAIGPMLINAVKVRSKIQSGKNLTAQDGEFSINYGKTGNSVRYDLRVNVQNTAHGELAVMRLQNTSSPIRAFRDLGMLQREEDILRVAMSRSTGLLVICGATGNGKSNTIWGFMSGINREKKNVISLESPVERKLDGVEQVPIGNAPGNTFPNGIRAALREAPHYIIVGETRDEETMEVALEASETGHFVATTLHANTAAEAPMRLLNMGEKESMNARAYALSTCLYAIMAQRLVRLLCTCAKNRPAPTVDELRRMGVRTERMSLFGYVEKPGAEDQESTLVLESLYTIKEVRESGCAICRGEGERGRTGIYECLLVTPTVRAAIRNQDDIEKVRAMQREQGGLSIFEQSVNLMKSGRITLQRCLDLQPD